MGGWVGGGVNIKIFGSVFWDFRPEIDPATPLDRPGAPRTSICTQNQPWRPIQRPFRGVFGVYGSWAGGGGLSRRMCLSDALRGMHRCALVPIRRVIVTRFACEVYTGLCVPPCSHLWLQLRFRSFARASSARGVPGQWHHRLCHQNLQAFTSRLRSSRRNRKAARRSGP